MMTITVGRRKFKIRRPKGTKKVSDGGDSSSLAASFPPWVDLPVDVTANILQRLSAVEIMGTAEKVCTAWRNVCKDPAMWRVIDINPELCDMPLHRDLVTVCRHAVDRSHGQLIDINIEYFGTSNLIQYISQRCTHLKRLRIACCHEIEGDSFSKAVKNFAELEELHLFFMPSITAAHIELIGTSCPKVKSFTFNDRGFKYPFTEGNEYALAVAKSMPNLQHLKLFGNKMKNEGLEAILDGCPHLKSLDIRQCFSVNLEGNLGKRCSKQIEHVRYPCDSTEDYEWDSELYDCETLYDNYLSETNYYSFSLGDYDDFFDPFDGDYYPDAGVWFFDHDYL